MAAEAAISSAVSLLGQLLLKKVEFLRGVKDKVKLLKDELERMGCFLRDANRKHANDESMRNWISDIREVAHDAKDVIEIYVLKIERKGMLGKISFFTKHLHHVNKVGKQIDFIQQRLAAIRNGLQTYGIKELVEASESVSNLQVESRRRLPAWQNVEHLVGIKDYVKKVVQEWIMDNEEKPGRVSVAVVEGMGGIGKSTLAREIYNHSSVVVVATAPCRFDCRGWVVVSSDFTLQETIKQLIFQMSRSPDERQKLLGEIKALEDSFKDKIHIQNVLIGMLYKQLVGRSYFIVLDDVWEMKHLDSLITTFPYQQGKPSRLLITTRNKAIAKYGDYALEMNVLDLNKSWELFMKTAFFHSNHKECPEEFEQIGRDIVEKCNGLPLAITTVGGLLVDMHTTEGWKDVLDQVNSHSSRAETTITSTILEVSYRNLSPHLKSCFLCLASFKEDANIPAKRLIHIWMGQGLIQPEGRRTMEEIGRRYLDELINRNMVQIKDLTVDGRVKNCHLHDLFHEVCVAKAKEEIDFEIVKSKEGVAWDHEPLYKPRHRVVYGGSFDTLPLDQNNLLRSLFVHNNVDEGGFEGNCVSTPFRFWKSFKLLEILCLEGVRLSRFPHSFRSLIGLRYLRIRCGSSETLKIPRWFDHLKRIEVVDARDEDVEFPNTALNMEKLRFFRAAHVHGLMSIENWKNIETLEYISLENLMKCTSTSTTPFPCPIRELGLFLDGESEVEELRRARERLAEMGELVKLHLMWDISLSIEPTMIPHLPNLTKLKLRGRMRKCPSSSMFPPNLSHLTLVETFIEEDPMAELGKLPKLMYLKLTGYACLGERMRVLHDGFPGLRGLYLKGMYFLRGINVEEGGMPQLKLLSIRRCPDLVTKNLPDHITVSLLAA